MTERSMMMKDIFKQRAIPIIENFLATDNLFKNLERDETQYIRYFSDKFFSRRITKNDLKILISQIRRILGGKVLFGLISDLKPE